MSRSRKSSARPPIRSPKPDLDYRAFFPEQLYHMTRVGGTLSDIADAFGVSQGHLKKWIDERAEMADAYSQGQEARNERVVSSLFSRAVGYSVETEKVFCNPKGEVTRVPFTERYPPDPGSCMFWLKNRQRGQWVDIARHEFTGEGGGPIKIEELVTQAHEIGKRIRGLTFENDSGEVVAEPPAKVSA